MTGVAKERRSSLWKRDPHNWYVEPTDCSAALFRAEPFWGRIHDPFAGQGNIVQSARAMGHFATGSDLINRGAEHIHHGVDFFSADAMPGAWPVDNIVTNPPYGKRQGGVPRWEEEALELALKRARYKVAFFLDAGWLNSAKRGAWLSTLPLYRIYAVGPRPACPPGEFLCAGGKAGNGRTDYCWVVFLNNYNGAPTFHWLNRREANA